MYCTKNCIKFSAEKKNWSGSKNINSENKCLLSSSSSVGKRTNPNEGEQFHLQHLARMKLPVTVMCRTCNVMAEHFKYLLQGSLEKSASEESCQVAKWVFWAKLNNQSVEETTLKIIYSPYYKNTNMFRTTEIYLWWIFLCSLSLWEQSWDNIK